jgi:ribose 5-phosphate isomerase B
MNISLAMGCDEAGVGLRDYLRKKIQNDPRVGKLVDFGVPTEQDRTPYPRVGIAVAENIREGKHGRGLLICGTGIGMAISANKVPGIRATTAHDIYSVERSVLSNNCQILALGARVLAPELAWTLVDRWLDLRFDASSTSSEKVQLISDYEKEENGHE